MVGFDDLSAITTKILWNVTWNSSAEVDVLEECIVDQATSRAYCLILDRCFLGLLFSPEDGGSTFL
jgi:hypothetical protein